MGRVTMMFFFSQTSEMHGLLAHMSTICTCHGLKLRENATLLFGWLGRLGTIKFRPFRCALARAVHHATFGFPPRFPTRPLSCRQCSVWRKLPLFLPLPLDSCDLTQPLGTPLPLGSVGQDLCTSSPPGMYPLEAAHPSIGDESLPRPSLSHAAVRLWRTHQAGY